MENSCSFWRTTNTTVQFHFYINPIAGRRFAFRQYRIIHPAFYRHVLLKKNRLVWATGKSKLFDRYAPGLGAGVRQLRRLLVSYVYSYWQ